eukprot:363895_1
MQCLKLLFLQWLCCCNSSFAYLQLHDNITDIVVDNPNTNVTISEECELILQIFPSYHIHHAFWTNLTQHVADTNVKYELVKQWLHQECINRYNQLIKQLKINQKIFQYNINNSELYMNKRIKNNLMVLDMDETILHQQTHRQTERIEYLQDTNSRNLYKSYNKRFGFDVFYRTNLMELIQQFDTSSDFIIYSLAMG